MEKIPHIRKISMEMDIVQALISSRLGWSQQQYCDFQMDAGYVFIHFITEKLQDEDRRLLSHSGLFWKWWRNMWFERDQKFYEYNTLHTEKYIYLHTEDLQNCKTTIYSFWSHADGMLYNGQRRIIDALQKEITA